MEIIGIEISKWIGLILSIILTVIIAIVAAKSLNRILKKTALTEENKKKLVTALSITIYLFGSIIIIIFFAFDIILALISLGVLGLGISVALGGFVTSIISGMMIVLDKDFKVGAEIEAGNFTGKIVKVTLRKTILETKQGERISVPNNYLLSFPVLIKKGSKKMRE